MKQAYSFFLLMCILLPWSPPLKATVYSNGSIITINDYAPATPFASVINVSGTSGAITQITLTLNGLTHSWVHDVSILLQAPSGESLLLQSGVADGFGVSNLTYTFSDAAPAQLSDVNTYTSGNYKPTGYFWDMFNAPAPPTPPGSFTYQTPGPIWKQYCHLSFLSSMAYQRMEIGNFLYKIFRRVMAEKLQGDGR